MAGNLDVEVAGHLAAVLSRSDGVNESEAETIKSRLLIEVVPQSKEDDLLGWVGWPVGIQRRLLPYPDTGLVRSSMRDPVWLERVGSQQPQRDPAGVLEDELPHLGGIPGQQPSIGKAELLQFLTSGETYVQGSDEPALLMRVGAALLLSSTDGYRQGFIESPGERTSSLKQRGDPLVIHSSTPLKPPTTTHFE